jgi:lysophospholipase L1-like esterase
MKLKILFFYLLCLSNIVFSQTIIDADNPAIVYSGRIDYSNPKQIQFGYSGVRIRTLFEGTSIQLKITSPENTNYLYVFVDSVLMNKIEVKSSTSTIPVIQGLEDKTHSIEVIKITESGQGKCVFSGFILDDNKNLVSGIVPETRKINFIGNSITCGYGIEVLDRNLHFAANTENFYDAYAAITARSLNADYQIVSRSGIGVYRNYGDPTTGNITNSCMYDIYDRILYNQINPKYDFSFQPDVICINLGTNDFSESKCDETLFTAQYYKFIDTIRLYNPNAKIVLLCGPMLNTSQIKTILQGIVQTYNTAGDNNISTFELSAQGSLGYGADWHPTKAQARKNASELIAYLSNLMTWDAYPIIQTTAISNDGKLIQIGCNENISFSTDPITDFTLTINNQNVVIDSIKMVSGQDKLFKIYPHTPIYKLDSISINYRGNSIENTNGLKLQYIQKMQVVNTVTITNTGLNKVPIAFKIYPNPAKNEDVQIVIESNNVKLKHISMYSEDGKLLLNDTFTGSKYVISNSIFNQSSSKYIVQISGKENNIEYGSSAVIIRK